MRRFALVFAFAFLAFAGGRRDAAPSPEIDPVARAAIRRALTEHHPPRLYYVAWAQDTAVREYESFELSRVEGSPDLYLAVFDWEERWWGDFLVVCFRDGHIQWLADAEDEDALGCNYVDQARGLRIEGYSNPIIEVYGKTHMGSGAVCLYELRGHRLCPLPISDILRWDSERRSFRAAPKLPSLIASAGR